MSINEEIGKAVIAAMKSKDEKTLPVLRMLKSVLKNKEIETHEELKEDEVIAVLRTEIKKRKDSAETYSQGGRPELAEVELSEIKVIDEFLPVQMTAEDIVPKAKAVLDSLPDEDKANFGKVMKAVMAELKGQADGSVVSQVIKDLLAG
jgi:uncharacterized protein